jgi:hypothetical protein
MTTIRHEPVASAGKRPWAELAGITPMWATLAIVAIWLSVLFSAVWAPDITSFGVAGDHTHVPAAVAIALFAALATWPIAWFGFRQERRS